jgi:hypothetical protein
VIFAQIATSHDSMIESMLKPFLFVSFYCHSRTRDPHKSHLNLTTKNGILKDYCEALFGFCLDWIRVEIVSGSKIGLHRHQEVRSSQDVMDPAGKRLSH